MAAAAAAACDWLCRASPAQRLSSLRSMLLLCCVSSLSRLIGYCCCFPLLAGVLVSGGFVSSLLSLLRGFASFSFLFLCVLTSCHRLAWICHRSRRAEKSYTRTEKYLFSSSWIVVGEPCKSVSKNEQKRHCNFSCFVCICLWTCTNIRSMHPRCLRL